jgi:hypothetical protein
MRPVLNLILIVATATTSAFAQEAEAPVVIHQRHHRSPVRRHRRIQTVPVRHTHEDPSDR